MPAKETAKSLKKNFIFYGIKSAMVVLFPLISFPYASRVLGVDGIGKIQYCSSIISYFALFAALGINTYAVREGVKVRDDRKAFSGFVKEIFTINLISTLIVYIALACSVFGGVFKGYEPVMWVSSLTIICTTLSVEWLYQTKEEYVYISIRTIAFQIISLICMFLFVKGPEDVVKYAGVMVLASGGQFLFNLIFARKYVDFGIKTVLRLKRHIKSIAVIFGINIASSIYLHLDTVMINFFYGDYQVGLYSVAMKIMSILRGVINSVSAVVMPRLSYYYETEQREKYTALLRKGIQMNLLLALPCMMGIIGLSRNIILLFSGADYLEAVNSCRILALNLVFATLDNVIYCQILLPHHQEKRGCIGTGLGAALNFCLNALLIPAFVIEGAAVASLLAELIVFVFFMYQLKKVIPFRMLFSETYKLLIGTGGIGLVLWGVKRIWGTDMTMTGLVGQTAVCVILSVGVYFGILWQLRYSLVVEEINARIEKWKVRK